MSSFVFLLIIGLILIFAELVFFSFTILWFFIVGLAALITAGYLFANPETIYYLEFFIASTVVLSLLLYFPLKRIKKNSVVPGNTTIGKTATAITEINSISGKVKYAGTTYDAKTLIAEEIIPPQTEVKIVKLEDITLFVQKNSWEISKELK